jgi:DNA-binding LytR/AlgR family response regulator
MKVKVVIIDDEPLAIDVLKNFSMTIDYIEVVEIFTNPLEAVKFLSNNKIDLVFLDIEMPIINGVDLIDSLKNKPSIIFTTAFPQYAVEGFNLDAVDYLLKPISYKRFLKAINKYSKISTETTLDTYHATSRYQNNKFIFVKSDYENLKINISDVKFVEGLKDYLKINLSDGKFILTLSNFSSLLEKINDENFVRVHNSFVVNINYIKSIQKNRILIDDKRIPITETYKKVFFEKIKLH